MDPFESLVVHPGHGATLALQLKQQLTWLIITGKLAAGAQLPPIRELAERLGINLHTVRSAYHKLEAEGLASTRPGSGTHVLPFDPARFAQMAAKERSNTVGVIIPSWDNPFYHALLQGVEQIAEEDDTLILLSSTHDDPNRAWRDFVKLAAKGVEGILLVSQYVNDFLAAPEFDAGKYAGVPFVAVDAPQSRGYSVNIDLEAAGFQAAAHLLGHGRRRIGLVTFDPHAENMEPIMQGFRRALTQAGVEHDPLNSAVVPDFSLASGAEGVGRLLQLAQPPDALFAIADTLALGAMRAIKQQGLRIPQDVALVSFNDIPAAAQVEPALTTIAPPTARLGREAMQMLKTLIAGRQPARAHILLPVELVIRQSCGEHADKPYKNEELLGQ